MSKRIFYAIVVMTFIGCKFVKEQKVKKLFKEAKECELRQNVDSAVFILNQILENDSNSLDAHLYKGALLIKIEKYYDALAELDRVLKQDSLNTMAYFYEGKANFYLDNYNVSISAFDQAIHTKESMGLILDRNANNGMVANYDVKYAEIIYWRGYAYYHSRQYQRAINDFDECIRMNYNKGECYLYMGFSYAGVNDFRKACHYINASAKEGNADALEFYNKYCLK